MGGGFDDDGEQHRHHRARAGDDAGYRGEAAGEGADAIEDQIDGFVRWGGEGRDGCGGRAVVDDREPGGGRRRGRGGWSGAMLLLSFCLVVSWWGGKKGVREGKRGGKGGRD